MEKAYTAARDRMLQTIIADLQQCSELGKQRKAWRIINGITRRKPRIQAFMNATSITERLTLFKQHFSSVLNQPQTAISQPLTTPPGLEPPSTQKFDCGPISPRELYMAYRRTSKYKAVGEDGVSAAAFCCHEAIASLRCIMNRFLLDCSPPAEWLRSIIVAIPKKSQASSLDGYRGISLMSTAAKLLNKVLLTRVVHALDGILLPWQSGFRSKRSTTEQICALRLIIDRCKSRKKDVVIVFVDFTKAFDSVNRKSLEQIILLYGVPQQLVSAIMALYINTTACVRTSDGLTDNFATSSGILQGDTLAPFLFVVVMDFVLRIALLPFPEDAFLFADGEEPLPALAYADDVALLARDIHAAERMVERLTNAAALVGLHLNFTKTEVLSFTSTAVPTPPFASFPLIKACTDFCYLGAQSVDSTTAFHQRRRLAWSAIRSLQPVFQSTVPERIKINLFLAAVEPVLFYAAESWVVTNSLADEIDASHRALLRAALNIHWPTIVKNDQLYASSGVPPASTSLRHRRLVFFGKTARALPLSWPFSKLLYFPPQEGRRRRGRPPLDYWGMLQVDLLSLGLTLTEAWTSAQIKKTWNEKIRT
jgi:hypothetical protein